MNILQRPCTQQPAASFSSRYSSTVALGRSRLPILALLLQKFGRLQILRPRRVGRLHPAPYLGTAQAPGGSRSDTKPYDRVRFSE